MPVNQHGGENSGAPGDGFSLPPSLVLWVILAIGAVVVAKIYEDKAGVIFHRRPDGTFEANDSPEKFQQQLENDKRNADSMYKNNRIEELNSKED